MAIDRFGTEFLLFAHGVGVDFSSTVTLGRQAWQFDDARVQRIVDRFPTAPPILDDMEPGPRRHADELFRKLGASVVDSIDASDFEGATIVQDLNRPIGTRHTGRYSTVVDGGTLEHVFNLPQALANAMALVAPGGHLLSIAPTNNQVGHGFYQISPELYFRTLSKANGFSLMHVLMQVRGVRPTWYELTDPATLGRRVEFSTIGPADVYVIARRTGSAAIQQTPQQSDYSAMWADGARPTNHPGRSERRSAGRLRRATSSPARAKLGRARRLFAPLSGVQGVTRVDLARLASRSRSTIDVT